jgi:hypothetical protein
MTVFMLLRNHERRQAIICIGLGAALAVASAAHAAQFPRVITGVVRDAAGEGIPGVLVEWGYFTAPPDERQTVTTGASGKFRLVTAKVGRDFRLGFSKRGYSPVWRDRVVPGPASRPSEFAIVLIKSPTLSLRFETEAGAPIAGLKVAALTPSNGRDDPFSQSSPTPATAFPGQPQEYVTDEAGQIAPTVLPALPVGGRRSGPVGEERSPNWLMLHVSASDSGYYEQQITEEQALGEQPAIVKLPDYQVPRTAEQQRGVIRGRVIDAETAAAVPRFWFTRRYQAETYAIDDADGQFRIGSTLEIGKVYEIRVFAPGYAVTVADLKAVAPETDDVATIELERHPSFQGRIVDAASGEPLMGVEVLSGFVGQRQNAYIEYESLSEYADGHHCLSNVLRVTTDADGRFIIPEAPDQPVCLILQRKGYELLAIKDDKRPAAGNDGVATIPLHRESRLTAVAIRETPIGAIAKNATLHFHGDDGFDHFARKRPLDDDGRATFSALPAGDYSLMIDIPSENFGFTGVRKRVSVNAGQRRAVLLGSLPGTIQLRGRGQPFTVLQFVPKFESEIALIGVELDVDGEFDVNHLEPGEYQVLINVSSASAGMNSHVEAMELNLTEDKTIQLRQ